MELKKQSRIDAGIVSDKFPQVAGIVIQMTYYHNAENPLLMERTVNIFSSSYAYFKMDCMTKGCENGGYDLTAIIRKSIKQQKKTAKGEMVCKGVTNTIKTMNKMGFFMEFIFAYEFEAIIIGI